MSRQCARHRCAWPAMARLVLPAALACAGALAGAATAPAADIPPRWQTPPPVPAAAPAAPLAAWWQQFDDPALPALVQAALAASPDLAAIAARIAQAEAARVLAGARAAGPLLDGVLGASRGRQGADLAPSTTVSASLQTRWEIDLFGGLRAARDASIARAGSAQADWHAARVSLAAEVADQLLALRACEQLARVADEEQRSRAETARLTGLVERAGLDSPANAALARAAAAQAALAAVTRQQQCGQLGLGLQALTGLTPEALQARLAPRTAVLPQPASLAVAALPAQALAQRPDLRSAALALEAAAADIDERRAAQRPQVSLSGMLGIGMLRTAGVSASGSVWTLGPLQVSLPLVDGGARQAATDAARVALDAAQSAYQARLRLALREVEDALLRLRDGERLRADARAAVAGFAAALAAAEQRERAGLANRLELEDLRRSLLQARLQQTDTERGQVAAWIALVRALGGGWQPADPSPGLPEAAAAPASPGAVAAPASPVAAGQPAPPISASVPRPAP